MARRLLVEIVGDSRSLENAYRRSSRAGRDFEQSTNRAARGALAGSGAFASMGRSIAFASGTFLTFAAATQGIKATISASSNLNESINATRVVFGRASEQVLAFSRNAERFGLSMREATQLASPLGAALINFGFSARQAAEETVRLEKRAADMASVFNTDVATALEAIQSLLRGESDPIEQFAVSINEAAVNSEALRLGLAKTTAQIDAHDKAVARLSLFYRQTAKLQGDFTNTSDQLANRSRILRARLENLAAGAGDQLRPVLNDLLELFLQIAKVAAPAVSAAFKVMVTAITLVWRAFQQWGLLVLKLVSGLLNALGATVDAASHVPFIGDKFAGVADQIDRARHSVDGLRDSFRALGRDVRAPSEAVLAGIAPGLQSAGRPGAGGGGGIPGAGGSAAASAAANQFVLPLRLRLAQARAELTRMMADDLEVARRIRDHITTLIASGKLKGEKLLGALGDLASANALIADAQRAAADKTKAATEKHAEAVKRAAEKQREAAQEAAQKLAAATDQARQEIGALFQGPILAPTEEARKRALGVPGPDPATILRDIRAQTAQALQFERDLRRLGRLGVGAPTIRELRGLGTGAIPQIEAILGARGPQRADLIRALIGRERAARRIGQMIVHTPKVTLHAKQVLVAGGGGTRTLQASRSGRFAGRD